MSPSSPFTSYEFDGHQYMFSYEGKSWDESRNACKSLGTNYDLATIAKEEDQEFLLYMPYTTIVNNTFTLGTSTVQKIWIGFNDKENEGNFTWIDGSETVFGSKNGQTPWSSNEPNNVSI